jgi:hypothetical protein
MAVTKGAQAALRHGDARSCPLSHRGMKDAQELRGRLFPREQGEDSRVLPFLLGL